MNVTIKGNLKDFVNKQVEEGLYEDANDFVRDALRKFNRFDPSIGNCNEPSDTGLSDLGWSVLGDLNSGDIEAVAFLVLMQAAKKCPK